ncbi:MAG: hypothetical protein Q9191_001119 [Dirinaria sp. TL-2023a]
MPDSDALAQLRRKFPHIPFIGFHKEGISYSRPFSEDAVKPSVDGLRTTTPSSSELCKCSRCGKAAKLKDDWKLHKESCKMAKSRQLLYRAASIIKGLLYIHQENTFTWAYFKKIERHERYCVVFLDEEKSETRKNLIVPFSTVVDATSNQQEQEAILMHNSCNDAVAIFGPYLVEILKGNLLSLEEITVIPKDLRIEILVSQKYLGIAPGVRKDGWHHTILRVTLTNNEQFAVDLTGAQYGHYQECLPWQDYVTTRVEEIIQIGAYGAAKQMLAEVAEERGNPTKWAHSLNLSFSKELRLSLEIWNRHGENFDTLLASPEVQYQPKKKRMLGLVKGLMEYSREESVKQGSWCRK